MAGRAAVFPLGGGNPPPAPQGRGHGVSDHRSRSQKWPTLPRAYRQVLCILLQIFFGGVFSPPYNPPRGLRIPPVGPKKRGLAILKAIKTLIIFWTRFLVDLGSSWGAKLGPKRVLEAYQHQKR